MIIYRCFFTVLYTMPYIDRQRATGVPSQVKTSKKGNTGFYVYT